jgi:hypothetical protein
MKNPLAIPIAISIILLMALTAVADIVPLVSAIPDDDCVCNHYNVPDENTANDIFTATGLVGADVGDHYSSVTVIWSAGSGGNYPPRPFYSSYCHYKYEDSNWNWQEHLFYYSGSFVEQDPFPWDDYPFEYEYYREYTKVYTSSQYFMRRFKAYTQNWFQNPGNPSTWVLIGYTWADIIA